MGQFNIADWAMVFLPLLILATITEAYDNIVTLRIRYLNREINLRWEATDQYLANNNLPLWSAFPNTEPALIPHVMEHVGPFVMYQDISKSSAVVFFYNSGTFFGIVDTRFYILGLPYSLTGPNHAHIVNGPYVKHRNEAAFHDYPSFVQTPPPSNIGNVNVNPALHPANPHPHQQGQEEILYAEILVFIANDIVDNFEWDLDELAEFVKFYIVYFNSIDMVYAKLRKNGIVIRLNIAGIVIEAEKRVLPYVFQPHSQETAILAEDTLTTFFNYMKKYKTQFPEDSYDFFFLSTGYLIMQNEMRFVGYAKPYDVYKNKKIKSTVHKLPGVIVQNEEYYADIFTAAHELGHTMHVLHDYIDPAFLNTNKNCVGMMQPFGSYCKYCIEWSRYSIDQFLAYSRNPDRCPLLNPPRSLQPYGSVIPTLTPIQQCLCYGYSFHANHGGDDNRVFPNRCDQKLECTNLGDVAGPVYFVFPPPVDGTPCNLNKVCWNKQCTDVTVHQ